MSHDERGHQHPSGDPRPGAAARRAVSGTFGRDLIGPGPGWPFGRKAKQRRARRDEIEATAARRRTDLQASLFGRADGVSDVPRRSRPTSTTPRQRALALSGIAGVVAVVLGVSWFATSGNDTPAAAPEPLPPAPVPSSSTVAPSSTASQAPSATGGLEPVEPIPPDGVAPIVPPPPRPLDPNAVSTVPAPQAPPTAGELASPEQAAVAWMARWCAFDHRQPYGTSQLRAKPVMTELGWSAFDPAGSDRGRASWEKTVAAGENGACSTPKAVISPEAPRSESTAIVIVSAERVVSGRDADPYVESLSETRIVQRDEAGQWRVDAATRGG